MDVEIAETDTLMGFYGAANAELISSMGLIVKDSLCEADYIAKEKTRVKEEWLANQPAYIEPEEEEFFDTSFYIGVATIATIILSVVVVILCVRCCKTKDEKVNKVDPVVKKATE